MTENEQVRRAREAAQKAWADKCAQPAPFDPDWVIPPGTMLRECLQEIDRTPQDLAEGTGLELAWIESFITGEAELTEDDAVALHPWTQIPTRLWMRWEQIYREGVAQGKTVIRDE
jgi:plasmid maintenance system antidote protein VapI